MSEYSERLEQQADLLWQNVAGFEQKALQRIGERIKAIGKMSVADAQAINNAAFVKQDMQAITKELARVTGMNIAEVEKMYGELIASQHDANKVLYDYRGKMFAPLSENRELQAMVRAFAKTSGESMINLSMTKALGLINRRGNFIGLQKYIYDAYGKAAVAVTSGTADFNSAVRDTIRELGGSGMRIDYGGGVTRRLDTAVRQNVLWGAKQVSVEYNEMIGEELGCDGIEIDWHSNPRPNHVFMQGKQYALGGGKTVNGITYESADRALEALADYGCLHFKTPIILGVSEPTHSSEELRRLNEQNKRTFDIDGKLMTGYECRQSMRWLETEVRKQRDIKTAAQASGDKKLVRECNEKIKLYTEKYNQIADVSGIKPQYQRMGVAKNRGVDNAKTQGYNISKGLSAKIGEEGVPLHEEPKLIKRIDYSDKAAVAETITEFEQFVMNDEIENALVITRNGEIYRCYGIKNRVFPDYDLGDKLRGATVSHNHPIDETLNTFSKDDLQLFLEYKLDSLRGCDEKYIYEFTWDSENIDEIPDEWDSEENYWHAKMIQKASEAKVGYRRWKR